MIVHISLGGVMVECVCGLPIMLYWLKDSVWEEVEKNASDGCLCLSCAEKCLGRPLTLNDLGVEEYSRTAVNMGDTFMREYVQAVLHGAFRSANLPVPLGWEIPTERPHTDSMEIGACLVSHTRNPEEALSQLLAELRRCFP